MKLFHPVIICIWNVQDVNELDIYSMYDNNSATSPDCYEGSERTTGVGTGESGADEANRTVNPKAYESNSAPRHVIYQSI